MRVPKLHPNPILPPISPIRHLPPKRQRLRPFPRRQPHNHIITRPVAVIHYRPVRPLHREHHPIINRRIALIRYPKLHPQILPRIQRLWLNPHPLQRPPCPPVYVRRNIESQLPRIGTHHHLIPKTPPKRAAPHSEPKRPRVHNLDRLIRIVRVNRRLQQLQPIPRPINHSPNQIPRVPIAPRYNQAARRRLISRHIPEIYPPLGCVNISRPLIHPKRLREPMYHPPRIVRMPHACVKRIPAVRRVIRHIPLKPHAPPLGRRKPNLAHLRRRTRPVIDNPVIRIFDPYPHRIPPLIIRTAHNPVIRVPPILYANLRRHPRPPLKHAPPLAVRLIPQRDKIHHHKPPRIPQLRRPKPVRLPQQRRRRNQQQPPARYRHP